MRSAPASLNPATVTSLVFVTAGLLAVASSLQQVYEKVFHQAVNPSFHVAAESVRVVAGSMVDVADRVLIACGCPEGRH